MWSCSATSIYSQDFLTGGVVSFFKQHVAVNIMRHDTGLHWVDWSHYSVYLSEMTTDERFTGY